MREIKFRVWHKQDKRYDYFDLLEYIGRETYLQHEMVSGILNEDTVEQYTGLKDKNGVEIYEGDIVRHLWYNIYNKFIGADYIVKFGDWSNTQDCENQLGGYGWYGEVVGEKDKYAEDDDMSLFGGDGIEVILNIHTKENK